MNKSKSMLVILLLAILAAGFFWQVVAHPTYLMTSGRGDLVQLFAARTHFQVTNTLKNGELTLWDPYSDCGAPVVGNIQNATFYPLNILFYIMPTDSAFGFIFLADTLLAGLFAYLFVRSFGLSRGAGVAGAITYMFSGIWTPKLFPGHYMIYNNFPWIILGLYLVRKVVLSARDGKWSAGIFFALLLAISQAIQFLGGHTQFWVYSTFFLIAFALFEVLSNFVISGSARPLAGGGLVLAALAVCAALVMIQLLPAVEFAGQVLDEGKRSPGYVTALSFSHDYWVLALLPHMYGTAERHTYWGGDPQWEVNPYVGIVPLILALCAAFIARNKYAWYFLGAGVVALLYAFGASSPVFQIMVWLPGFSAFRAPTRMLTVVLPAVAVLAAFGWQALFTVNAPRLRVRRLIPIVIALMLAVWMGATLLRYDSHEADVKQAWREEILRRQAADPLMEHKMFYQEGFEGVDTSFRRVQKDAVTAAGLSAACVLLFGLAALGGRPRTACGLIAIALIAGDLAAFGIPFMKTLPVNDPLVYPEHTPLLDYLAKDKSFYRISEFYSPVPYHQLRRLDYNLIGGDIDSSKVKHFQDYTFFKYANLETNDINNALNVKYFITRIPAEEYRKAPKITVSASLAASSESPAGPSPFLASVKTGNVYVTEYARFFPRAFVVRKVVSMKGALSEDIMLLLSNGKVMKDFAVIEEEPDFTLNKPGKFQAAEITDYQPNRLTVEVTLDEPGFLVLSEVWYPDWRAYDVADGGRSELHVYKTNLAMRGVFLKAGKHKVEFVYEPRSYYIGKTVTLISVPIVLVLLIVLGVIARRRVA